LLNSSALVNEKVEVSELIGMDPNPFRHRIIINKGERDGVILGQRFPAGYPVATVKEVIHDSGQPFAIVRAVPTAALNRSRYLLLVFTDGRTAEERANEAAQAQEALDQHGGGPIIPATVPKPVPATVVVPAAAAAPAATPAVPAPASTPAKPAAAKPPAAQPAATKPPATQPAAVKPAAKPPVSAPATTGGRE
jgi:rod shape-determining protein MreC